MIEDLPEDWYIEQVKALLDLNFKDRYDFVMVKAQGDSAEGLGSAYVNFVNPLDVSKAAKMWSVVGIFGRTFPTRLSHIKGVHRLAYFADKTDTCFEFVTSPYIDLLRRCSDG